MLLMWSKNIAVIHIASPCIVWWKQMMLSWLWALSSWVAPSENELLSLNGATALASNLDFWRTLAGGIADDNKQTS